MWSRAVRAPRSSFPRARAWWPPCASTRMARRRCSPRTAALRPCPSAWRRACAAASAPFIPAFRRGGPAKSVLRLLGREYLDVRGRGAHTEPVLVWAETGRTDGLKGSLGGLSGAPALDAGGRVIGVTIAEAPRRGRIYTTAPEVTAGMLAQAPAERLLAGAERADRRRQLRPRRRRPAPRPARRSGGVPDLMRLARWALAGSAAPRIRNRIIETPVR